MAAKKNDDSRLDALESQVNELDAKVAALESEVYGSPAIAFGAIKEGALVGEITVEVGVPFELAFQGLPPATRNTYFVHAVCNPNGPSYNDPNDEQTTTISVPATMPESVTILLGGGVTQEFQMRGQTLTCMGWAPPPDAVGDFGAISPIQYGTVTIHVAP